MEDIGAVLDRTTFLPEIGIQVKPLVDGVFNLQQPYEIKLTGDFKAIIPQELVKTGLNFAPFVDYLQNAISSKA